MSLPGAGKIMYKPVVELVREENISNHSFNWPRVCLIYTLGHHQVTNTFEWVHTLKAQRCNPTQ